MKQYGGDAGFKDRYPVVKTAEEYNKKRMAESASALQRIRSPELGGAYILSDVIAPYCPSAIMSHQCITDIAYCLGRIGPSYLARFINSAVYRRLQNPRRRKDTFINSSDWSMCRSGIQLFERDIHAFLQNPANKDHAFVQLARSLGGPDPAKAPYTVNLRGNPEAAQYKFWEKALDLWRTLRPAKMFELDKKPTPYLVHDRITAAWLQSTHLAMRNKFLVPASSMSDSLQDRISTIPPSPSPQRAKLMAEAAIGVRASGRSSIPPGGSPLTLTRPFEYRGESSRGTAIHSIPGNLVQSIEADRSRLSSVDTLDLDTLAEEAGYGVGAEQDRTVQRLKNYHARGPRHGSVASVPDDHRAREVSTIKTAEFRSLEDASGQTAVYPSELEEVVQQEREAIGADVLDQVQSNAACRCADKNSPFVQLCKSIANSNLNDPGRVKLIRAWVRECCRGAEPTANTVNGKSVTLYALAPGRVCFPHLRFAAGKVGLLVRSMSKTVAINSLMLLHYHPDLWGAWRADARTRILFQNHLRTPSTMDNLQSYRYRPVPSRVSVDWDGFMDRHASLGYKSLVAEFKTAGTVRVDVFGSILKDPELALIVGRSFDMYDYHTRMIHGKDNLGWCRTMYHSLVQQLVRGDLEYWLLYAVLRQETNFISYPYYTKYTKKGDSTAFRHVDCNLADAAADGRGINMIQGSVSFDDEDEKNCTEALAGFHNHVPEYLQWRQENSIDRRNGYIEGWKDERDYPQSIQKQLGCRWTKYPCKTGEVRISHPLLPHGSTGPATTRRRTVLPWFVRVTEDGNTMEVPEMGSYQELAAAHQALRAGPSSPSGHANKFGGVPYAFPGDITPEFSSWIAKAVHCQARYDSYPVLQEIDSILNTMDSKQLQEKIQEVRAANVAMVKKHWLLVQEAEKKAYRADTGLNIPSRSFFANQGRHPAHVAGWEHWDGQQTRGGAIAKMFSSMNIEAEDATAWDAVQLETSSSSSSSGMPPSPTPGPSRSSALVVQQPGSRYNTRAAGGKGKGKGRAE